MFIYLKIILKMNTVTIEFYGKLKELAVAKIDETFETLSILELDHLLQNKYPILKDETYIYAINNAIATNDAILKNNDKIACMPPFSGG